MDYWDFYVAWGPFEDLGLVDGSGGAQYRRCHAEWEAAGCPFPVEEWIALHGGDRGPGIPLTADDAKRRLDLVRNG